LGRDVVDVVTTVNKPAAIGVKVRRNACSMLSPTRRTVFSEYGNGGIAELFSGAA
jgi:hypothetical protein